MAVPIDRLVEELEKLKEEMDAGALKHGDYDQRLSRIIAELKVEKLDADRATVTAMLDGLLARGVITPSVKDHLLKRLGLG